MVKLNSGYCEKCNEQLINKECPYCTKPTPSVLVWHDEKRTSWSYCGRFEIVKMEQGYGLYRIYHDGLLQFSDSKSYNTIGTFVTLETAKLIASIIRTNEI